MDLAQTRTLPRLLALYGQGNFPPATQWPRKRSFLRDLRKGVVVARGPISKRTRFEVFKRDAFKCQYCGRSAPDVVLQVDHIQPVAKGGGRDILNLITSCSECNSGKSDRLLDDSSAIGKQRQQLEILSERREQMKMMLRWRDEVKSIDDEAVKAAADRWSHALGGRWHLNEKGTATLAGLIHKVGLPSVLEAMDDAIRSLKQPATEEDVNRCWGAVGAICTITKRTGGDPGLKRLYYIRGIVRRHFGYCNERLAMELLRTAHAAGHHIEKLEEIAKTSRNWTDWHTEMEALL